MGVGINRWNKVSAGPSIVARVGSDRDDEAYFLLLCMPWDSALVVAMPGSVM